MSITPPSPALRALIDEASGIADKLFEPDGQMLAYILAVDREGKSTLLVSKFVDGASEVAFRVGGPIMLRRLGSARWCFFTEAWMAAYPLGADPTGRLPADRADKLEVVTFAAEEAATGERIMASRQIYREAGKPARLLPLVITTAKTGYVINPAAFAPKEEAS